MRSLSSFAFCFLWLAVAPAIAQTTTAELAGSVTDPSGAAIAKAKVVAANTGTGLNYDAVSDDSGGYLITLLPPGTYTLSVEAPGFRRTVQNNLTLEVNQRAKIDFKLQLGAVSETVEVAAAAPLLESQSSTLGSVVTERLIADLPLNGRNFVTLAIVTPGVNGTGFSTGGTIMSGTRPDDRRPAPSSSPTATARAITTSSTTASTTTSGSPFPSCSAPPSKPCANSRCRPTSIPPTSAATPAPSST